MWLYKLAASTPTCSARSRIEAAAKPFSRNSCLAFSMITSLRVPFFPLLILAIREANITNLLTSVSKNLVFLGDFLLTPGLCGTHLLGYAGFICACISKNYQHQEFYYRFAR